MADFGFPTAEEVRGEDVLYRTPKGAFFVHSHRSAKFKSGKPMIDDSA